jgi:hypothetical protein
MTFDLSDITGTNIKMTINKKATSSKAGGFLK